MMKSGKLLITAFEPFGQNKINTSYEAVQKLGDVAGIAIKKVRLPVLWEKSAEILLRNIKEFDPDAVIMCGLASGSESVRIERVGINLCGAIKDNAGVFGGPESREYPIKDGGDAAYFSTFDYENILSAMRAAGIPAVQSFSAGTYICNYVLYSALASEYAKNKKVGFIHVPDAEEFGGKLPLETIAQALEIAVRNC